MSLENSAAQLLEKIRSATPLVHNITNFVVMNPTANALLALGASPIMAHEQEELPDLLSLASALVINIGTLDKDWIDSMREAGMLAREKNVPMVLDPVGAGASRLRTATALQLLEGGRPRIVRSNASEMMALAGEQEKTRGVDSLHDAEDSIESACYLASENDCICTVSSETDLVTDGSRTVRISGGHALMSRITGMGCTASALCGAYLGAEPEAPLEAAAGAMAAMACAGSMAAEKAQGPGTFSAHFMDALHCMTPADIRQRVRVSGQ